MTMLADGLLSGRALRSIDVDAVVATLTSAFVADPVIRWMYPAASRYLAAFPRFMHAFGGAAFRHGTVLRASGDAAAAMWLAPGIAPDGDAIEACLLDTVDPALHESLFAVFADMDAAHPEVEHWYLPWFGTDAAFQSRGLGSRLMRQSLETADVQGLPAYLETPNPRNIGFYERHGFAVTGRTQHGTCPPVTFMWREAR